MNILYDKYYKYLSEVFCSRVVIFLIVGTFLALVSSWFLRREKDFTVRMVIIFIIIIFIIGSIIFILPYGLDLLHNEFVVFEGSYKILNIYYVKSDGYYAEIQLDDSQFVELSLKASSNEFSIGENIGTLVYSKYTKILFFCDS